eukprot:905753-Lingulodinium_polyedra.AAC.1
MAVVATPNAKTCASRGGGDGCQTGPGPLVQHPKQRVAKSVACDDVPVFGEQSGDEADSGDDADYVGILFGRA